MSAYINITSTEMMRALFIGDHTMAYNWGGRAQSLALYQLLSREFFIQHLVKTDVITSPLYIGSVLPIRLFNFLSSFHGRLKPLDFYFKCEEMLGARDFIGPDIEESVKLLLKYRSKNSALNNLYEQVKSAELIIINGEGAGIFTSPHRRDFLFYLTMIELSVQLGKKCFYVNGIISDCPYTGRNQKGFNSAHRILKKCKAVLVRDYESLRYIEKNLPGINALCVPDALFSWFHIYERDGHSLPKNGDFIIGYPERHEDLGKLDFSEPYICIGGSSGAAHRQDDAAMRYEALADKLKQLGCRVYLTQNCGGDRFMQHVACRTGLGLVPVTTPILMAGAVLTNAQVFISGRFHPTIHASLGGTPCVFLDAHSHKMKSLQEMLGYEDRTIFSALPNDDEIQHIITQTENYMKNCEELRKSRKLIIERLCEEAGSIAATIKRYL